MRSSMTAVAVVPALLGGLLIASVGPASAAAKPPAVTGLTPPAGHLSGGDKITIVGHGLGSATRVHFGSAVSTQVSDVTATRLRVVTPPHAAGTVSVRVDTDNGRSARNARARFTYADPPARLDWSAPENPDPVSLRDGYGHISCATAELCVTFGLHKDAPHTQLMMLNNGPWRWVTLSESDAGPAARADKGACPTVTFCLVVGWSGNPGEYHATAWTWDGTAWTVSLVESHSLESLNADSQHDFGSDDPFDMWRAATCARDDTYCLVQDDAGTTMIYDDGSWTTPTVTFSPMSCATRTYCLVAALAGYAVWDGSITHPVSKPFGSNDALRLVSCAPPTFCLAVSRGSKGSPNQYAVLRDDTWSGPAATGRIEALSCSAAEHCRALGPTSLASYGSGENQDMRYDGSSWSVVSQIGKDGTLFDLSCWNAGVCRATNGTGKLLTLAADQWTRSRPFPRAGWPTAVSCTSASMCMAVDYMGNALLFEGNRWQAPVRIDGDRSLASVSCPSNDFCFAIDGAGYVLKFVGGHWQEPRRVLAFGTGVSCSSTTFCMAVSGHGTARIYDGHWRKPQQVTGPHGELKAVSCTSADFCAAVSGTRLYIYNGSWHRKTLPGSSGYKAGTDVSCVQRFCAVSEGGYVATLDHGAFGVAIPRSAQVLASTVTCSARRFCLTNGVFNSTITGVGFGGASWADAHVPTPVGFGDCTRRFCMVFTFGGAESHAHT